ncbi:MAG: hypothetical protein JKY01_13490 [Pseudomonadales bacterium]|nr:hypothetical protein [Pseudomonadales bacterium]
MPWQFPGIAVALFFISGVVLFFSIVSYPDSFWTVLVSVSIFTSGVYALGFAILDDYLVTCITAAGVLNCTKGVYKMRKKNEQKLWTILFYIFIAHLLMMGIVGVIAYGNVKAIRLVIVFMDILILTFLVTNYEFKKPDPKTLTVMIAWVSVVYFTLVIIHWLFIVGVLGFQGDLRFISKIGYLEGLGNAGAGYKTVAGVLAVPAAFMLLMDEEKKNKLLGSIVLFLVFMVAILSDSRAGVLPLIICSVLMPFSIGLRKTIKMYVGALLTIVLITSVVLNRPQWVFDMSESILGAAIISGGSHTYQYHNNTVTSAKGDSGRYMYVEAAVTALVENPHFALTGVGNYGYFPVSGEYFNRIASERGSNTNVINMGSSFGGISEPPRPPAMGAMIAEYGLVGFGLFVIMHFAVVNVVLVRKEKTGLYKLNRGKNIYVLAPVVATIVWGYFAGLQDICMIFLMLMPYGILHEWSRLDERYEMHNDYF